MKNLRDELLILWLADKIYAVVKDEKFANEAMQWQTRKLILKSLSNNGHEKYIRFT